MRIVALALLIVALALLIVLLSGCFDKARVVTRPGKVITRDRLVVEPVADTLTEERPIATGPLADCPRVASDRKRELEIANAQLRAIRAKHGKGGQ